MAAISFMAYPSVMEISRAIAEADTFLQVEIFIAIARRLKLEQLKAILAEIECVADEEESVALMRLARALNERDAGPAIEA